MTLRNGVLTCLLLFTVILSACSAGNLSDEKEKQQVVNLIKEIEINDYNLYYFKIDYDTYLANIEGMVSEEYLDEISDRIIFGYDGVEYTSKELIGMPHEEWKEHKKYMLNLIRGMDMEDVEASIQVSNVYKSELDDKLYLYTSEIKALNGKSSTKTNKKYTIKLIYDQWLVTSVEQDKFTLGSEMTPEEIQTGMDKMKYQTHEEQPVQYQDDVLVLKGVAEN
jgi:hypothetical protein